MRLFLLFFIVAIQAKADLLKSDGSDEKLMNCAMSEAFDADVTVDRYVRSAAGYNPMNWIIGFFSGDVIGYRAIRFTVSGEPVTKLSCYASLGYSNGDLIVSNCRSLLGDDRTLGDVFPVDDRYVDEYAYVSGVLVKSASLRCLSEIED